MRHLVDWTDVDDDVWNGCLRRTLAFALDRTLDGATLAGRNLGLVFFNDSLRTRVSMELAMQELGGRHVTVTPGSGTWGFEWSAGTPMTGAAAEHIKEAVGVLGRYVDALGVRLFASGTDYQQHGCAVPAAYPTVVGAGAESGVRVGAPLSGAGRRRRAHEDIRRTPGGPEIRAVVGHPSEGAADGGTELGAQNGDSDGDGRDGCAAGQSCAGW